MIIKHSSFLELSQMVDESVPRSTPASTFGGLHDRNNPGGGLGIGTGRFSKWLYIRFDRSRLMWSVIVYDSGSQPGLRVPPGVREKSEGVRQIVISLKITQRFWKKNLANAY